MQVKTRPVQTIKVSTFNFYYSRNGRLLLDQNYTRYIESKYLIELQSNSDNNEGKKIFVLTGGTYWVVKKRLLFYFIFIIQ